MFFSLVNIVVSGSIALLLALHMYRATFQTRLEMAAYMGLIISPTAIVMKLTFNMATGVEIVFDPYGLLFRVAVLFWLLANHYALQRDGVSILWSRSRTGTTSQTFAAVLTTYDPSGTSMCDESNDRPVPVEESKETCSA